MAEEAVGMEEDGADEDDDYYYCSDDDYGGEEFGSAEAAISTENSSYLLAVRAELLSIAIETGELNFHPCKAAPTIAPKFNSESESGSLFATSGNSDCSTSAHPKTGATVAPKPPQSSPEPPQSSKKRAKTDGATQGLAQGKGYQGESFDMATVITNRNKAYNKLRERLVKLKELLVSCPSRLISGYQDLVMGSTLVETLANCLSMSIISISDHAGLVLAATELCCEFATKMYALGYTVHGRKQSTLSEIAGNLHKLMKRHAEINEKVGTRYDKEAQVMAKILETLQLVVNEWPSYTEEDDKDCSDIRKDGARSLSANYVTAMNLHKLKHCTFTPSEIPVSLRSSGAPFTTNALPASALRRIMKEACMLNESLPVSWESCALVRIHDVDSKNWRLLITGPKDTPYENGCFVFNIVFPYDYPHSPPALRLLNTGGGTHRFNPNLYADGKVCLSLLGTWSGVKSETWTKDSTMLQVVISIQSLILVQEPWYNEPGHEGAYGTPSSKASSDNYNLEQKRGTVKFAIIEMIKNPPEIFREAIMAHFWHKRQDIKADILAAAGAIEPHVRDELFQLLDGINLL